MNTPTPTPVVDPNAPQILKPANPAPTSASADPATPVVADPAQAPAPVATPTPPKPFVPPTPAPAAAVSASATTNPQSSAPASQTAPTPEPPKGSWKEKTKSFFKKDTTKVSAATLVVTLFLCLIVYLFLPIPAGKITAEITKAQLATKAAKAEVAWFAVENKEAWEWYEKATANEKMEKARADILTEDKAKLIAANIALDQQVKEAWQQWTELNTQSKLAAATQALKKPAAPTPTAPSKSNDQDGPAGVRVTVEADGTTTTSSGYRRYTIPLTAENLAKMTNGDPKQELGFDRKNRVWRFRDQDPRDGMTMEQFKQWAEQEAAARGKKNFRFVEGEKTRAAIQAGADPFDRPVRQ